jgi:hypothetical protein
MNLRKRFLVNAAAFAVALCLTPLHANAQRATFNLPFAVHWGRVVFERGPHAISVLPTLSLPRRISVDEENKTGWILALTEQSGVEGGASYLKIVTVGEEHFVREYYSQSMGKKLTFPIPSKSVAGTQVQASRKVTLRY